MRIQGPRLTRARKTALTVSSVVAIAVGAALPSVALASFAEFYGGYSLCGNTCYFQSAGAHTFYYNEALAKGGSPYLACQLTNFGSTNEVSHGYGSCYEYWFGGNYVWARVYNESGKTYSVIGYATTP
jgi:hypothetical protein